MARALFLLTALWGVINCVVFLVGYQRHSKGTWRDWPMGRHMMGLIVSLLLTMTLVTASLIWGPLGPWPWAVALAILNVFLTQRNYYLFTDNWRSSIAEPSEDTIREIRERRLGADEDGG